MPAARPYFSQPAAGGQRVGLARALSKLGVCSRSQGREWILSGRVRLNGKTVRDPEYWVDLKRDRVEVDARPVEAANKVYLMLNKPRGLVTSAADERQRATVYSCFKESELHKLPAVGRLDMASEGLLLFSNDSAWAERILSPKTHVEKIYHVQVNCVAGEELLRKMENGLQVDADFLAVSRSSILRRGSRNSWLEIVLSEGKNRHIRRLCSALRVEVLRLVRVSIGGLQLGTLPKGHYRFLTDEEVKAFAPPATRAADDNRRES